MIIVKIGGSLYGTPYLKEWVQQLSLIQNKKIIIVPGGGPFANQVRNVDKHYDMPGEVAHNMAVLGMQQFAYLLLSMSKNLKLIESYQNIKNLGDEFIGVWMPYVDVRNFCDYPKNWQTTSDSLAAWLANKLDAEKLCLIKSANIDNKTCEQIIDENIVDEYFSTAISNYNGQVQFFHSSQANKFLEN